MKILIIGGTGTISSAVVKELVNQQHNVYVLNRGNHNDELSNGVTPIVCDINDVSAATAALSDYSFDVVADFIAFKPKAVQRDVELFSGRCKQYVFISSASCYQKPPKSHIITEDTPLCNPYWQYSQDKIACENYLFEQYEQNGFPVTIVRPSHTYGNRAVPTALHGNKGSWQVVRRIMECKPVIVPGDGESLWTITHNTDFAPLFCALLGKDEAIGKAYHITSGETLTWNRIYDLIGEALGKRVCKTHLTSRDIIAAGNEYGYDFEGGLLGDKSCSAVFDNSKVLKFLPDYKMKTPFNKGVKQTVDYILAHEEYQQADEVFDRFCDEMCKGY
ncbi:MAG: SDR family oxidoreductase [Acutalibacteraceae bacterium]